MGSSVGQKPIGYLKMGSTKTASLQQGAAVYVHFPFCRKRCSYCDFDSFTGLEGRIGPYLEAVVAQVEASPPVRASTLYVGGGTPSLMGADQAARLVQACRDRFGLAHEAETTLEANPSDLDRAKLEGYRAAGFNRLSVGVQSVDDGVLRLLGRRHSAEEAGRAIALAREVGFDRVSVDLIYGIPTQDSELWRSTLETVVDWGVDHLSCYMLSVELGTPLEGAIERGELPAPFEDEAAAMYGQAVVLLAGAGFRRYEISNWARAGRESAHNLFYWRNQPYLGIGAGAAGSWEGRRYKIQADVPLYIRATQEGRLPLVEDESPDRRRDMSDTMILGLRLDEGVSRDVFLRRYGCLPEDVFGEALAWGEGAGLLTRGGRPAKADGARASC